MLLKERATKLLAVGTIGTGFMVYSIRKPLMTSIAPHRSFAYTTPTGARTPTQLASSRLLARLSVLTEGLHVRGSWTIARLHACLPRLVRFLVSGPRKRRQQEAELRHWLDERFRTTAPGGSMMGHRKVPPKVRANGARASPGSPQVRLLARLRQRAMPVRARSASWIAGMWGSAA